MNAQHLRPRKNPFKMNVESNLSMVRPRWTNDLAPCNSYNSFSSLFTTPVSHCLSYSYLPTYLSTYLSIHLSILYYHCLLSGTGWRIMKCVLRQHIFIVSCYLDKCKGNSVRDPKQCCFFNQKNCIPFLAHGRIHMAEWVNGINGGLFSPVYTVIWSPHWEKS